MLVDATNSHGPHQVKLDSWVELAPFERLLNMEIQTAEEGHALLTMPFCFEYAQGAGIMHGGAITALADTALAMAVKTLLPENTHFGTISLETRFLKAVRQGQVQAEAKITEFVERDLTGEVSVRDDEGNEVMLSVAKFRVARKQNKT